jgi:nitroreductase
MDVLAAIRRRVSVRSYSRRSVDRPLLDRLLGFADTADHLTETPPRVALVSGVDRARKILTYMIGSYGLVQNPPHLLVGILPEEADRSSDQRDAARLDLGYVLEQVVLEATRMGVSTCWVTGSYDARRAGAAVGLSPGETAAAVCAVGYPTERGWGQFHSRIVRRLAGGHRRRSLQRIVFSERWGEPWSPNRTDATSVTVLEHARLAPSATNRQPWRFIVRPGRVALALVRRAPIDAGIVMSHVALASAALGRAGHWQVQLGDAALARNWELPDRAIPVGVFV